MSSGISCGILTVVQDVTQFGCVFGTKITHIERECKFKYVRYYGNLFVIG